MKKLFLVLLAVFLIGCCKTNKGYTGQKQVRSNPWGDVKKIPLDIIRYRTNEGPDLYQGCIEDVIILWTYEGHFLQPKNEENKPIKCHR